MEYRGTTDALSHQSLPPNHFLWKWTWASYQIRKIAGCACAGNAGNVFPRRRFQRKPLASDPGMHHGTCVTHVPWCMSRSLTCGDGENVPGIPGACALTILRIWQEAHDDNIKYKSFQRYGPFVRTIQQWPVNSFQQGPVVQSLCAFLDVRMNKRLTNGGVAGDLGRIDGHVTSPLWQWSLFRAFRCLTPPWQKRNVFMFVSD